MNKKVGKKKAGRPVTTGKGEPVMVRILPDLMSGLDAWITKQDDTPSRPEGLRRIAADFLKRKGFLD